MKGERAEPVAEHTVIGLFRTPGPDVGVQVAGTLNGAGILKIVMRSTLAYHVPKLPSSSSVR